jgi:hypothetical protein
MIRFYCSCGAEVFFDSRTCEVCKSQLAFNPSSLKFERIGTTPEASDNTSSGSRLCQNGIDYDVCNWMADSDAPQGLCFGCQFNRIIPNLSRANNITRWATIEANKKRLLFSMIRLGLPPTNGWQLPGQGLLFDFLEDTRSTPTAESSFVTTGFLAGVITLNVLEADPASRFAEQEAANEVYRTVLGHLRHESGHYVFSLFSKNNDLRETFLKLFGDDTSDYAAALRSFYANGPLGNWHQHHITPYASAHPSEDWAETWGHYLHIQDTLETAASFGIVDAYPEHLDFQQKIHSWRRLSVGFNELNRSMGLNDAYPFVINDSVAEKLGFADRVAKALKLTHQD